ncbi:unnamed protein product, partial [marine sediment metagenome]
MKLILSIVIFIIIISIVIIDYKIIYCGSKFTYPYNKKMAYISSWDDTNNINSFLRIIELYDHFNLEIPLTIFLNTEELNDDNIAKYKYLLAKSKVKHTIESHSVNHPKNPNNIREYIQSQRKIRKIFGQNYAKTYCYPFGIISKKYEIKNLIKKTYIAARTTKNGYVHRRNLYDLHCLAIEDINQSHIIYAINGGKTIITYGHGIKGIGGWNPINENDFIS